MASCCVKGCNSNSRQNEKGISFFRFPKSVVFKKKINASAGIEKPKPSEIITICSKHFDEKSRSLDVVLLRDNGIPSLYPLSASIINKIAAQNRDNTENTLEDHYKSKKRIEYLTKQVRDQRTKIKLLHQKWQTLNQQILKHKNIFKNLKKQNDCSKKAKFV